MIPNILTGLSRYTRAQLVVRGAAVKEAMSVEGVFPTLTTPIADYIKAYDEFVNSIPSPNVRNKENDSICEAKTKAFKTHYASLGNFVRGVAMGNEELLNKSGFVRRQTPHPWPLPNTPKNVDAFATNDVGVMLVTCDPEKHVDSYIARVSTDRQNWMENFSASSKVVLMNVPTGVTLFVEMLTKNRKGKSLPSKIVETRLPAENEPVIQRVNLTIENI